MQSIMNAQLFWFSKWMGASFRQWFSTFLPIQGLLKYSGLSAARMLSTMHCILPITVSKYVINTCKYIYNLKIKDFLVVLKSKEVMLTYTEHM
jgi:hypothetical protein